MRALGLSITLLTIAGLVAPAAAANPVPPKPASTAKPMLAKPLSAKEIKADFGTGKPFKGVTVPGGQAYLLTLNTDGTAKMTMTGGANTSETGKWRVSATSYCSTWGKSTEHCYEIQKNGKAFDVLNATHKVVAHWTL